jgi:hypothetical protein
MAASDFSCFSIGDGRKLSGVLDLAQTVLFPEVVIGAMEVPILVGDGMYSIRKTDLASPFTTLQLP